ncbi:MAG TPA: ornithine cyclodeaminase family protein, partial [Spirochaetia bacterium]|nr:ornithine cyclodeaminase family protein [Spirochaetia bacterium]
AMAILIREEEVHDLLPMSDALTAVEEVFRIKGNGKADNRPRQRPRLERAMLQVMPGAVTGMGLGLKAYTVTPKGVRFVVLLWDDESGELLAMIEANELGSIRTGASSGVATKYLARQDSRTVGIFGSGFQAFTQLEAVSEVREIGAVYVYGRSEAKRRSFAERASDRLKIDVSAVERPQECAACDIVITITNAADPVFAGGMVTEGAHINAAGSNRAEAAEIGGDTLERAGRIVVDDLQQAKGEAGDLIRAVSEGRLAWERVEELAAIVAGRAPGRSSASEITLFESLGIAIEDIAVARRVYDNALKRGAGERLPKSILG